MIVPQNFTKGNEFIPHPFCKKHNSLFLWKNDKTFKTQFILDVRFVTYAPSFYSILQGTSIDFGCSSSA